jgi:ASC-1-like (ASCH) protein
VVKVRAESVADAIDRVNRLLTDNGEYRIDPFDWVAEDETKISATVKTEADFRKLREMERDEHIENLRRSGEEADEDMKGFYLRKAGECLEANFWSSTERLAYTLDWEGANVYYVDTDRHC